MRLHSCLNMADKVYRRWDDGFVVRRMIREDAAKIISWCSEICATSVDLQVVLDVRGDDTEVDGFYVGELNGEMVASKIEIEIADGLNYGSMFYVDERYRRSGLGRRINDVARDMTERVARRTVGIDTRRQFEAMNMRRGYKMMFAVTQFTGTVQPRSDFTSALDVRQIDDRDFDILMSYDDKCFIRPGSTWRRELMSRWIKIPGGRVLIAVNQPGDVVGYGCRRPAVAVSDHHLIGPLYADSYDIAVDLVHALTSDIAGQNICINVCDTNKEAVRLVGELKLYQSLHMIRMYRNGDPKALNHCVYGITSIDVCGF